MTLRDLLKEVSYKSAFNFIYKSFLKIENASHDKIMDHDLYFHTLFMSLRNQSYVDPKNNKIYITYIDDKIDVCLFDDQQDEIFALDSLDYKHIIDMEIYKAIDINDTEIVAHVLRAIHNKS